MSAGSLIFMIASVVVIWGGFFFFLSIALKNQNK